MNIRSKGNAQRAFVRVADLFKEVEDQIRIKELKISQEVSKLELKLINTIEEPLWVTTLYYLSNAFFNAVLRHNTTNRKGVSASGIFGSPVF